jgi:transposase
MAYREVTMLEVKEVLRLWLKGRPTKAIARTTGLARNTARSYIRAAEACGLHKGLGESALKEEVLAEVLVRLKAQRPRAKGDTWTKCEQQRTFIEERLDDGVKLTKVRKLMARSGVEVSYATLHRFATDQLDFGKAAPTIPVADCAPGQEVQVDTGWVGQLEPDLFGKRRRFCAWIFSAVRSRHRYVHVCFRETTESAIEACEAAWAWFGGVFAVLIPDNTKTIVQVYDPIKPTLNATFLEYAQARGFEIDPTRRRSPKDKGRVERAVRTTREDCFGGERLQSIEAAQQRARSWARDEYGMRRHSTTWRMPLEHFEAEEKAHLLPVPVEPYDVPQWSDPKVGRDQRVQVARALYSVPQHFRGTKLVGAKLRARADSRTVRLYFDGLLVKTHPRKPPGGSATDPADYPAHKAAYANRDVDFLERQAQGHGAAVGRYAKALLEGPLPWTRMRQVYALLGLCKRYGSERVDEACGLALDAEMLDVRRLERMLQLGRARAATTVDDATTSSNVIPLARYLRPAKQYALTLPQRPRRNPEEDSDA